MAAVDQALFYKASSLSEGRRSRFPLLLLGGSCLAGTSVHTCLERCLSPSNMRAGHVRVSHVSLCAGDCRPQGKRKSADIAGQPRRFCIRVDQTRSYHGTTHIFERVRFRSIVAMCIVSSLEACSTSSHAPTSTPTVMLTSKNMSVPDTGHGFAHPFHPASRSAFATASFLRDAGPWPAMRHTFWHTACAPLLSSLRAALGRSQVRVAAPESRCQDTEFGCALESLLMFLWDRISLVFSASSGLRSISLTNASVDAASVCARVESRTSLVRDTAQRCAELGVVCQPRSLSLWKVGGSCRASDRGVGRH